MLLLNMQQGDMNRFSWSQAFANSVTGKTSISAVSAFISLVSGIIMFMLITIMVLFTKDSDFLASLISLAAMATGIAGMGSLVLFGNKSADSKEVIQNLTSMLPDSSITSKIKSTVATIETTEQKKSE